MGMMSNEDIFGTPPEPIFETDNCSAMNKIMLEEWLHVLMQENEREIQQNTPVQNYFKKGDIATKMFLLCEKLQLNGEARYLAIELFNMFMVEHVKGLHSHVKGTKSKKKVSDFLVIQKRISNQVLLRMISCCQIASKMTSHYKVVTSSRAVKLLNDCGYRFSRDGVLMSEIRVLKTLDYKINIHSPLAYLETLLELLGLSWPECNLKISHGICQDLLDVVYMKHTDIYNQLYCTLSQQDNPSQQERSEFSVVEADKMLLSASIIVTSIWIYDRANVNKSMKLMEQVSRVPQEDITDFCSVLIRNAVSY